MMYQDRFVVAIKNNGRVLREHGDTTYLPFGCEYSILLKNKNSVRALVRVDIDGVDVTGGIQLIVPANGSIDLERFIKDGNFERGHKFKFIERTQKIEDGPRGILAEDGLIRIEFEFEREPAKILEQIIKHKHIVEYDESKYDDWRYWPRRYWPHTYCAEKFMMAQNGASVTSNEILCSNLSSSAVGVAGVPEEVQAYAKANEVGITVRGAESDQKFESGAWFPTDGQKHVMILKLLGQVGEKKIEKPVTVKTKTECSTCGTLNSSNAKFCQECGTAL